MDQDAAPGTGPTGKDGSIPAGGYLKSRGVRFPKDPAILTHRILGALCNNTYERKEAEAIARVVNDDDTVMELGGGIGFISTLAAKRCRNGAVHSFEANPTLIPYIRRVHEANGITNADVNHALLGPRKGQATFYVRRNFLSSSLDRKDGTGIVSEENVEIRNAKAEAVRIKPTVLICDIEGAEVQVIPALNLSSVRVAVVELHPQWIGSEGVRSVFQAMMDAGLIYYPRRSNTKVVCFRRGW